MKAFVTGASRGIGLEICKQLAKAGYKVIGVCRDSEKKRSSFWQENNDGHMLFSLDITNHDDVSDFFALNFLLLDSIDVLVNNAGITQDSMFHKMSYEQWVSVINTNLTALFSITQPIYLSMKENNTGRIINISSVNAQKGQAGQTNYCATKSGVHGFTKSLALEAARHNITVNTISPGYTNTSMIDAIREDIKEKIETSIPLKRFATPFEIAKAVCYLVSDDAAYITGTELSVNGGLFIG